MRFTLWRTVARPQSLNPNLSRAHALTRSRALELGLSALEALEVRLLRVHQRLEPLCSILVPFTPRDLRERGVHGAAVVVFADERAGNVLMAVSDRLVRNGVSNLVLEELQVSHRVILFALRQPAEQRRQIRVAFHVRALSVVLIADGSHCFARESILEVLKGLGPVHAHEPLLHHRWCAEHHR
eukprot:CAMPEP_0177706628 /NCGR_PEP_ID=MMETSP0484_2-20121128/9326_1 /TAXON_ID=354590 /ORGANISM="Rhodomonas lens, Strain RHODO" /LENGTH=183 /DNA_ID=CAMNT_0019218101 /DNA_START=28 /DNA_END=579 /DNA_ORIENTATION=+